MKLTVIGRSGPYPDAHAACSGYLLQSENTNVLIECGTGVLSRLGDFISFDALDAVLLTHLHYDHMSDMLPMIYALQFNLRKNPLPVFAPDSPAGVRALLGAPCYAMNPMCACTVGDMQIAFLPVRHPVETYAVRIECGGKVFVFTGDTNEFPALAPFAAGADLLMADAGLSEADWLINKPHLSARRCGVLAAEARVGRLLLTHLNPKYDPDALASEAAAVFENTEFVQPGAVYSI